MIETSDHLFATDVDGGLAFCSCGQTNDLDAHARAVLPHARS